MTAAQRAHQLLHEANACHDADPAHAAALLRELNAADLAPQDAALLAFLLNHVLGELHGQWPEAHSRMQPLHTSRAPAVLRQAAVAARLGGDATGTQALTLALAQALGGTPQQADELVVLACAAFTAPRADAAQAGRQVLAALEPLQGAHWQLGNPFDAAAATQCNNIAAGLSERAPADYAEPALASALLLSAERGQSLWQRAGDWVNRERAGYGRAVALNALGLHAPALEHARQALNTLDQHDHRRFTSGQGPPIPFAAHEGFVHFNRAL